MCVDVATPNSSIDENGDNTVSTTVNELTSPDKTSAVFRHIRETGHNIDWKNWIIISKDRHPYRLCIRESLAIAELQPSLNGTIQDQLHYWYTLKIAQENATA